MANCYITARPCTLKKFVRAAKRQGFKIEWHEEGKCLRGIIHKDGRGCYGIVEEEHFGETYIGTMGNPHLREIELVDEGSDEYRNICADEEDNDDSDDGAVPPSISGG